MQRATVWLGTSLEVVRGFPEDVKDEVGHNLWVAETGGKGESAKPLQGFGGAGVLEIVADDSSGTYRVVYTVRLRDALYVLHAFKKKSTQGIKTSPRDLKIIETRLKEAERISAEWCAQQAKEGTP